MRKEALATIGAADGTVDLRPSGRFTYVWIRP